MPLWAKDYIKIKVIEGIEPLEIYLYEMNTLTYVHVYICTYGYGYIYTYISQWTYLMEILNYKNVTFF